MFIDWNNEAKAINKLMERKTILCHAVIHKFYDLYLSNAYI